MKTIYTLLFTIILSLSLASCVNNNTTIVKDADAQKTMMAELVKAEQDLYKTKEVDRSKAVSMIDMYVEYSDKYPEDTVCGDLLFKAAEIAMNFEQPNNAIRYLTKIETDYINYRNYGMVIFMKAYVFDNYVNNKEKAKEYYSLFIEKYPEYEYAEDAKSALMFLDMNDDQLIEFFQDMNKTK